MRLRAFGLNRPVHAVEGLVAVTTQSKSLVNLRPLHSRLDALSFAATTVAWSPISEAGVQMRGLGFPTTWIDLTQH
jgi:hypothetical protein